MTDRICHRDGCGTPLTKLQRTYCSLRCSAMKGRCPMSGHTPEWPPERVAVLAQLWDDGLSASAIGLRMGLSKNAVVGKSHRLQLPPRPSPIRPSNGVSYRQQRLNMPRRLVAGIATLPALASLARKAPPSMPTRHTPSIVPPKTERPIRVPPTKPERPNEPARQCAFLTGDKPHWRQCEAVAKSNSPYCEHHHAICYIRTPKMNEWGAAA
jgi:GcrA cell cycle regulator